MFLVFAFLSSALAQTEAGEWVLQMKAKKLEAMRDSITLFIKTAAEDKIINGEEINHIQSLIKNFKKEKQTANKWLKKYGLAVGVEVDPLIVSAVKKYKFYILFERDPDGTVQLNLIEAAKLDREIKIESSFNSVAFYIMISVLAVGVLLIVIGTNNDNIFISRLGVFILIVILIVSINGL